MPYRDLAAYNKWCITDACFNLHKQLKMANTCRRSLLPWLHSAQFKLHNEKIWRPLQGRLVAGQFRPAVGRSQLFSRCHRLIAPHQISYYKDINTSLFLPGTGWRLDRKHMRNSRKRGLSCALSIHRSLLSVTYNPSYPSPSSPLNGRTLLFPFFHLSHFVRRRPIPIQLERAKLHVLRYVYNRVTECSFKRPCSAHYQ